MACKSVEEVAEWYDGKESMTTIVPWVERPTLDIDLSRPIDRWFEGLPEEVFVDARRLLASILREIPFAARLLAQWVRLRTWGRFHEEAVLLAGQVGADWRDVVLANVSYDLMLAAFGCSTVALPSPVGPVLARNMDWWPEDILAQTCYLLRFRRQDGLVFANAAWPGAIGVVTGLSGRSFAIVLNAVLSPEGIDKTGYPVLLHLRRVLEEARDFDEALKMLAEQHLTAPALITLAGGENHQRVVIERTPKRHALRWAEADQPLVATNDYRLLFRPQTHEGLEIYQTTCSRYDALCEFFRLHRPQQEVKDSVLLTILSDPTVIQGITAQHVIMRPRLGEIRLFVPRRLLCANA